MRYLYLTVLALLFSFASFAIGPIIGTTTICQYATTALTDASPGGTWTSTNTIVAVIGSSSGVVTSMGGIGPTTITYYQGGTSVTTTVTVVRVVGDISGPFTVCQGSSIALSDSAACGIWSSTNTAASVNPLTGVVTGGVVSASTLALVYYTLPNGCSETGHPVTVYPLPAAIIRPAGDSLCPGACVQLSDASPGGTWTSSNSGVATIGYLSGQVCGATGYSLTCRISYTLSTGCFSSFSLTIGSPSLANVTGPSAVCVGGTIALSDPIPSGTWSSNLTFLATVTSGGVVTGVAPGNNAIFYSVASSFCGPASVWYPITVVSTLSPIAGITTTCNGSTTMLSNASLGGNWSSSVPAVASIVAGTGLVTGGIPGTTVITYAVGTSCTTTTTVTVVPPPTIFTVTGGGNYCSGPGILIGISGSQIGVTYQLYLGGSPVCTAMSGTGSALNFPPQTMAGIYTVAATSSSACMIAMSGTATITVAGSVPPITGTTNVTVGSTTTLSNAAGGGTWTSVSPGVATIGTGSGIVTGVATGTSIISYTTSGGCIATTTVTVTAALPAILCVGNSILITDTVSGGTWSSSNTNVATVVAGAPGTATVTGVIAGSQIIKHFQPSGVIRSFPVTVNPLLAISSTPTGVCQGQSMTLTNGTPGGGTWSSSNVLVASVVTVSSSSGTVGGVSAGSVTITFTTVAGCKTTRGVTVYATGTLSGTTTVCMGQSVSLSNSIAGGGGTWSSSNSGVATVVYNTGVVTGVLSASTVIRYTSSAGCISTIPVTVNPLVQISAAPNSVCKGQTLSLADGTSGGGTWSCSNTNLATVVSVSTSGGTVTGVSGGAVTITFTTLLNCKATKALTVNPTAPITGVTTFCRSTGTRLSDAVTGGTWSCSNTGVATVTGAGVVTAIVTGAQVIRYTLPTGCMVSTPITISACRQDDTTNTVSIVNSVAVTSDMKIFPNPTTGNLAIQWKNQGIGNASAVISDMLGREIYRSVIKVNTVNGQTQLDLGSLNNGVYLITLKSDSIYFSSKLMIQK